MPHREGIREYLKDVQVRGSVVDWGCGTKPIMNYLKKNKAEFCNVDKTRYEDVHILADFDSFIVLPKRDFDYAFCIEVIEHCWNSKQLVENIYRHLKDKGVLYLSQPFMYEVHKEDDRVRFTYHGLRELLEETGFTVEDIQPTVGDLDHAEGYILRARK